MIVGLGVAHEKTSSKNQPHFPLTMMRLGKTKPKEAFRLTQNAFNKLLQNLKKIIKQNFLETD